MKRESSTLPMLPLPVATPALIGLRELALIGVVVFVMILVLPPIVRAIERRRQP